MGAIKVTLKKKRFDTTKLREGVVRVGWFEGVRYKDGVSVAQVAYWNEYGTGGPHGIPKRPFMRPAVHQNRKELQETLRSLYRQAIKDNTNTMDALESFGVLVQAKIRRQILSTTTPANSPITVHGGWLGRPGKKGGVFIKGKGFNKPLQNTGYMVDKVDYQCEEVVK